MPTAPDLARRPPPAGDPALLGDAPVDPGTGGGLIVETGVDAGADVIHVPTGPEPSDRPPGGARPLPTRSLKGRALRSSAWTAGGHGAQIALRLGGNLVLTRLLVPDMFGLMALVNIVIQGLQMFSDVGIGPSIIQNRRGDDPRFLRTAWTISVIRGTVLWAAACLLAVPAAGFYEVDALTLLIPLAGLNALTLGFGSTGVHRLNRHLELGAVARLTLACQTLSIAGMILWAWVSPTVLALVVPGVLGNLVQVLLSHRLMRDQTDDFGWDRAAAGELVRFGRWIFLSTLLAFGTMQADRLVFGRLIPLDLLGVYGIALMLATMPNAVILKLGQSVAFPTYARVRDDAERFARIVGRTRSALLLLGASAASLLIAAGPPLIGVMYDDRYAEAGWIVTVLACGAFVQVLSSTNGAILLAQGRSGALAAAQAAKLATLFVLIIVGYHFGGFSGAVVGVAASELIGYGVSAAAVRRGGLRLLRGDAAFLLAVSGVAGTGWWLANTVQTLVHARAARPQMGELAAVAVATLWVAACWGPMTWRQAKHLRGRS